MSLFGELPRVGPTRVDELEARARRLKTLARITYGNYVRALEEGDTTAASRLRGETDRYERDYERVRREVEGLR